MQRLYEKLIVWKEAHLLCLEVYRFTKNFPPDERYSLVNQMRRSASSIAMNIAEGSGRQSLKEKIRFLTIATGSLEELHYQGILARDLTYITTQNFSVFDDMIHRVGYLLYKLSNSMVQKSSSVPSAPSASSVPS